MPCQWDAGLIRPYSKPSARKSEENLLTNTELCPCHREFIMNYCFCIQLCFKVWGKRQSCWFLLFVSFIRLFVSFIRLFVSFIRLFVSFVRLFVSFIRLFVSFIRLFVSFIRLFVSFLRLFVSFIRLFVSFIRLFVSFIRLFVSFIRNHHRFKKKFFSLERYVTGRFLVYLITLYDRMGHAVAQLVEALRYNSEGRGFDSRWCHCNFSLT